MAVVVERDIYNPATYTFNLAINKNGGDTAPSNVSQSVSSNASSVSVSIAVPSALPTWAGHRFLGYAQAQASNPVSWQPGDVMSHAFSRVETGTSTRTHTEGGITYIDTIHSASNQSFTRYLFAKWELMTYNVGFDANGGTGAPASLTKTHGTDITLPATSPTRTNYNFLGWSTSSTGSVEYQPGDSFTVDADTTLYAIWALAAATLDSVSDTAIEATGSAAWTKVSASHAYKLKLSFGNAPLVTVNVAANSESCSFTIPATWYDYITNATSGMATAILETYTDANYTTLIGSTSKTFTVSVASSVKPTISALTATPHSQNNTVEGWGVAVQGYSYATIDVTATPGTGASISNIEISGPGINQAGSAASGNTGILTATGTNTFTVIVTDSRGRSSTETVPLTVYEYSNPIVTSLDAVRCLANGTISETEGGYIKAFPVFVYSSVNGNNSLSVKKIEYKKHTDSTWTTATSSAASGSWTSVFGPADISITYDVKCTVTDALNNTYALEVIVPPVVGFGLGLDNDRACFGGPPEEPGLVTKWDFKIKGNKTFTMGNTTMTEAQLQSLLAMI